MRKRTPSWLPVLTAALLPILGGCGDDSSGPNEPPPPDLSTPRSAVAALEDLYSRRRFDATIGLHSPDFRFYPALPESIPFLDSGETFWTMDREAMILERLLIPERITWLDQVLLEVEIEEIVDSTATLVRLSTETELRYLLGAVLLESSRSAVDFIYEKNADGDHILKEQRERLWPGSDLTYGELKAEIEDAPSVETMVMEPDSIGATRAVLRGSVVPNALATTYWFEWGLDTQYGTQSTPQSAGASNAVQVFQHAATGLSPSTLYHYRIVAESSWGTSRGDGLSFMTAAGR